MAFDATRSMLGPCLAMLTAFLLSPAANGQAGAVLAYPEIDGSAMIRNVNTPQLTPWRPNAPEQSVPLDLVVQYRDALAYGDMSRAYALFHEETRLNLPLSEFVERNTDWVRGRISFTRQTWYPQPAGQPHHLYVAMDLVSRLDDGRFACGFVMMSRIANAGADFKILSTEMTYVDPNLLGTGGMPPAPLAAQLNCWLGDDVRTLLNN